MHPSEKLKVIESNFALGMKMLACLNSDEGKKLICESAVYIFEDEIKFVGGKHERPQGDGYHEVLLCGPKDLNFSHAILEFSKMLVRNVTTDAFEAIYNYCEETKQDGLLHQQPWYRFARIVRNSVTHDQCIWLDERRLSWLPVQWQGSTITEDMLGKELTFEIYGWWHAVEMIKEMKNFCRALR